MELFLSLNKKKVKGNLSPPIKCKIIQIEKDIKDGTLKWE